MSSPGHHFMAIRYSLDSRCKPKLVEGTTDSPKKNNEGLPPTGDELCWHVKKNPSSWQKVSPLSFLTKPSGVGLVFIIEI